MLRVLLVLSAAFSTSPLLAQWYDFDPIVLHAGLPEGSFLRRGVRINDLGQALYVVVDTEMGRTLPRGVQARVFVDDREVYVGPPVTEIGDINDAGDIVLTRPLLTIDSLMGEQVAINCRCSNQYAGVGGDVYSIPRIDGTGNPYFIASTQDQLDPRAEGYHGEASIVSGHGPDLNLVFDAIRLEEGTAPVDFANFGWDVNELGEVAIGGQLIPPGESLDSGLTVGLHERDQISVNNHGEFTRLWPTRRPDGTWEQGIAVFGDEFEVFPTGDREPKLAILNDNREIAFMIGKGFYSKATGISTLDTHSGEIQDVLAEEDREVTGLFYLHDFNDAGQLAIQTSAGYYLVSPISDPNGDLNFDGVLTDGDIDRLTQAVRAANQRSLFDLNQDGVVTSNDVNFWIDQLANTVAGDADMDGDVDFGDFLALSAAFGSQGGWASGDFDGSGFVDMADFLLLSSAFGTASAAMSVPEPAGPARLVLACLFVAIVRRALGQ